MANVTGHHLIHGHLTEEEGAQLNALIAARGYEPTARAIGCGITAIEKLCGGGFATHTAIGRVRAGLAKLRAVPA